MSLEISNLEAVNCNFCQGENTRLLFEKEGFKIVRCLNCGLTYVNPRLKKSTLVNLYDKDYYKGRGFDKTFGIHHYIERPSVADSEFILNLIERYISGGKLIDIGCGEGALLKLARQRNWDAYGFEVSDYAYKQLKDSGFKVFNGKLENIPLKEDFFDAMVMHQVIEHAGDPKETLKTAFRLLKRGGIFFISTGNIDSLVSKICGKHWEYVMPQGHIYYFSRRTLKNMLEACGFKILKIAPPAETYDFYRKNFIYSLFIKLGLLKDGDNHPNNFLERFLFGLVKAQYPLQGWLDVLATK